MQSSSISHDLPRISDPEGKALYGGAQQFLPSETLIDKGCGLISTANVFTYLARFHHVRDGLFDRFLPNPDEAIALSDFNASVLKLCRGFFRPIPGFGLTGIAMAWGFNRICRRRRIPFRAKWCMRKDKLWQRIADMLEKDLPVIFAVGPNFPRLWGKELVTFYRKKADGTYYPSAKTCAHFVTITGMDPEWLRISSWGREYYVNRKEYTDYADRHSSWMFCNVMQLTEK